MIPHSATNRPPILVTATDLSRLQDHLERVDDRLADAAEALGDELLRAQVIPSEKAPETLVTMNSRVVFENLATGREREVTLVYPNEANAEKGRVSVLAPVGSALLGLSVGQEIEWPLPDGGRGRFRIKRIVFQPEAEGRFDL
jgi:regulator of nucleoside diphosphate kinase